MKVVLVDYSSLHDPEGEKTSLPDKRSGKFVQIRRGDTEYLVFSSKELASYHAHIVERFCRERGIRGAQETEGKRFSIHDPGWTVVGGGKYEMDKEHGYLRLYDDSVAYGKFDPKGLKEKLRAIGEFHGLEVRIE
jgi:hypothetical protein